ncbi:MAG TPA: hypothetical protein VN823_24130, partial [Stellaceae bacterium]|nr:hypothetical protein [Stellaceae bacterium]
MRRHGLLIRREGVARKIRHQLEEPRRFRRIISRRFLREVALTSEKFLDARAPGDGFQGLEILIGPRHGEEGQIVGAREDAASPVLKDAATDLQGGSIIGARPGRLWRLRGAAPC